MEDDFFDALKKLRENLNDRDESISAHYGVKKEEHEKMNKEILCDFINLDLVSDIIDKNFPNLKSYDKYRVAVFAMCFEKAKKFL